jgi:carbamoyl-phosphate synthase small subunit
LPSPAVIVLEDGRVFSGEALTGKGSVGGELVFNTSMSGYQEIATDPSYAGQVVVMTYPLIGNYGANAEDVESARPWVEGFAVREISPLHSNWRSAESLDAFLARHGITGISGIDTRSLTRHLRSRGAMKGIISTRDLDVASLHRKAQESPGLVGRDLVREVACATAYRFEAPGEKRYRVAAIDCGIKRSILERLAAVGCDVTVFPAAASSGEILAARPDGVFLSNGPGDPEGVPYVVKTLRELLGKKPVFGICLGHQMLGLALGGRTYKLKFGHRGANHPVMDQRTGRIDITSQNHGFCVDMDSLNPDEVELTHVNLYDRTLEGMRHRTLPAFSVQYHPEASPGPHDARHLFDDFVALMESGAKKP